MRSGFSEEFKERQCELIMWFVVLLPKLYSITRLILIQIGTIEAIGDPQLKIIHDFSEYTVYILVYFIFEVFVENSKDLLSSVSKLDEYTSISRFQQHKTKKGSDSRAHFVTMLDSAIDSKGVIVQK